MLPHLASAHSLAFWLLKHSHDAEDAVQDSYLRAYKGFRNWNGDNALAWILRIVRNTCMTRLQSRSRSNNVVHLDTVTGEGEQGWLDGALVDGPIAPEAALIGVAEQQTVRHAVGRLAPEFREVIILREFEDLSYSQIAEITEVPIGTVMSRLSRARRQLRDQLHNTEKGSNRHEM